MVEQQQLQMIMHDSLHDFQSVEIDDRYELRFYRSGEDDAAFIELLQSGGFDSWNEESLTAAKRESLPGGMFVIVDKKSEQFLATAMAGHSPTEHHPFGGELGWVATRPEARGRGLGKAVCVAVLQRFCKAGYKRVYLKTDDWRLPAIHLYLKLGFVPYLFASDMRERWEKVCSELSWPSTPKKWPEDNS